MTDDTLDFVEPAAFQEVWLESLHSPALPRRLEQLHIISVYPYALDASVDQIGAVELSLGQGQVYVHKELSMQATRCVWAMRIEKTLRDLDHVLVPSGWEHLWAPEVLSVRLAEPVAGLARLFWHYGEGDVRHVLGSGLRPLEYALRSWTAKDKVKHLQLHALAQGVSWLLGQL